MQQKDNRLDFISIQANDLLARINRMLKHNNTRLAVRTGEVVLTFKTETEEITNLLSVPAKIGIVPVKKVHLVSAKKPISKPIVASAGKHRSTHKYTKRMAGAK